MLRNAYNYLERKQRFQFRDIIIEECGFSYPTFYNYLQGATDIPKLVSEKIREIIIKKDYPKKMLKIFDSKN